MEASTFDTIWNQGIEVEARRVVDDNEGSVIFNEGSKYAILARYNELNKMCKSNFMFDSDGLLDRHKVCAALIIAIIQVRPLINIRTMDTFDDYYAFNEKLAFRVGLSILAGYVNNADNDEKIEQFVFPQMRSKKEQYEDIFCKMIRFDNCYNQLSVLSLANILFLLERYSLLSDSIG